MSAFRRCTSCTRTQDLSQGLEHSAPQARACVGALALRRDEPGTKSLDDFQVWTLKSEGMHPCPPRALTCALLARLQGVSRI